MEEKAETQGRAVKLVEQFVGGTHRLAITSRALAELSGLVEEECRAALEALAAEGLIHKDEAEAAAPLYCKG